MEKNITLALFLRSWREVDHERFEEKNVEYTDVINSIVAETEPVLAGDKQMTIAAGRFVVEQLRHNGYDMTTVVKPSSATFRNGKFAVAKKRGRPLGSKKVSALPKAE